MGMFKYVGNHIYVFFIPHTGKNKSETIKFAKFAITNNS